MSNSCFILCLTLFCIQANGATSPASQSRLQHSRSSHKFSQFLLVFDSENKSKLTAKARVWAGGQCVVEAKETCPVISGCPKGSRDWQSRDHRDLRRFCSTEWKLQKSLLSVDSKLCFSLLRFVCEVALNGV